MDKIANLPIDENLTMGIDTGIGSCAIVALRTEDVAGIHIRCFPVPETPKKKKLHNVIRREHRLTRRQINRRRQRRNQAAKILSRHLQIEYRDIKDRALPRTGEGKSGKVIDPWEARSRGLDEILLPLEFASALLHIAKRRGFRSNSKKLASGNDADGGKALQGIARMSEKNQRYRTMGEMLFKDPDFARKKRNSPNEYSNTIARAEMRNEVNALFSAQRNLGGAFATEELQAEFLEAAFFQRPLQASEHLVGACPFEKDEKRAASMAPVFEKFRYLSKINNLSIANGDLTIQKFGERVADDGLRKASALFGTRKSITYKQLRKAIGLSDDEFFVGVPIEKPEGKSRFWEGSDVCLSKGSCAGTYALSQALKDFLGDVEWSALLDDTTVLDEITFIVSFREEIRETRTGGKESIERGLLDSAIIPEKLIEPVLKGVEEGLFKDFKGTGHISALAARKIIPHLERGLIYSKACEAGGYDHALETEESLENIKNPVVRASISESARLLHQVILDLGVRPGRITIELARDVGKPVEVRAKIEKAIKDRESERKNLREEYADLLGKDATDDELLAFQLWKEQGHQCLYSGNTISPGSLDLSKRDVEIDHILPRSRSQDNSYHNKMLCLTSMNQAKGDRSPSEWLNAEGHSNALSWEEFNALVEATPALKGMKKRNLLMPNFADREQAFVSRNINDTRYSSRVFRGIAASLYRDEPVDPKSGRRKRRVFTRPGPITAIVRRSWGMDSLKYDSSGKRRGDLHHAVDAAIVAALGNDEALTQGLIAIHQKLEGKGLYRRIDGIPLPWAGFRSDVEGALETVLVSRPERRKGSGEGHEATIRRVKNRIDPEGERFRQVYERKDIFKVTEKDLARLKSPERHEILIQTVRDWLNQDTKTRPQFPRMPTKNPEIDGPEIRKLRLPKEMNAGVEVHGGFAGNGSMARVDVYQTDAGYWMVPVYVNQIADKKSWPDPPNAACVAYKKIEEWVDMCPDNFLFSLHPWSYVRLEKRDGDVVEGYFRGLNVRIAGINVSPHMDSSSEALWESVGVKSLLSLQKYHIDLLGRKSLIKSEPRLWHGAASI